MTNEAKFSVCVSALLWCLSTGVKFLCCVTYLKLGIKLNALFHTSNNMLWHHWWRNDNEVEFSVGVSVLCDAFPLMWSPMSLCGVFVSHEQKITNNNKIKLFYLLCSIFVCQVHLFCFCCLSACLQAIKSETGGQVNLIGFCVHLVKHYC